MKRILLLLPLLQACDSADETDPPKDDTGIPETPAETGETGGEDTEIPAGTGETGLPSDLRLPISDLTVEEHPEVPTILVTTWTQKAALDSVWLEFSFENDEWLASPAMARDAGEQREVALGIPGETEVRLRLAAEIDGFTVYGDETDGLTGWVPDLIPAPIVNWYDPVLASPERYLLGSVDADDNGWYGGPCYTFIIDREGRIVWYHLTHFSRLTLFPQIAADGTHLVIDATTHYSGGTPSFVRTTLDRMFYVETELDDVGFSLDEIDGEKVLYDQEDRSDHNLVEYQPDGTVRHIWNCNDWMESVRGTDAGCSVNSVIYAPLTDSVLWSMYQVDTVVEVDRESGEVLWYGGQIGDGWAFDPEEAMVDYQHYPNYSADGTLIVSTHIYGESGQQRARELVVDYGTQTLRETWSYGVEVDEYATYGGEAIRLENGNTLICYGTGGAIREVTPDKRTAWDLDFVSDGHGHLLGHDTLLDDLYALNVGPGAR